MRRVVMHSIDPHGNRFRFFVLEIREHDGQHQLVRRWGRIGTAGREAVDLTGEPADVAAAWDRVVEKRLRRGYRVVEEDSTARSASGASASPPQPEPERELGALVAWEARLVDALVRTRRRLTAVRERLRPQPTRPARAASRTEQLDLFAALRRERG